VLAPDVYRPDLVAGIGEQAGVDGSGGAGSDDRDAQCVQPRLVSRAAV
jgi:hypothetical protein